MVLATCPAACPKRPYRRFLRVPTQFHRYFLGLVSLLALLALPHRSALADNSHLILQSNPAEGETVYPGDTLSYTVSIARDHETLDWAWLRITLGEGMQLDESSILLDCARAVPVDLLPPGSGGAAPTPRPISREVVPGNNGFVLLSSALLNGDSISFSVLVEEGAELSLSAQTEQNSISIAHILGVRPPAQTPAPAYVYTPPEPPPEPPQAARLLWLWITLGILAFCGILYLLHLRGIIRLPIPAKKKRGRRRRPAAKQPPKPTAAQPAKQPGARPQQPSSPQQRMPAAPPLPPVPKPAPPPAAPTRPDMPPKPDTPPDSWAVPEWRPPQAPDWSALTRQDKPEE